MKFFFFSFIILSTSLYISAQGLVLNGDFEQYNGCPIDYSQIDSALNWTAPTAFNSTDYFNACTFTYAVDVPWNGAGYQLAHSGEAYAGIYVYSPGNIREYLSTTLDAPLEEGNVYHVEMYVSTANASKYASDNIGIYLSDTIVAGILYSTNMLLPAQVYNPLGVFPDTATWTLVSADIIADGGEQYIVIGNFFDDPNTQLSTVNAFGGEYSYIYIDDVQVSTVAAVLEEQDNAVVQLYPNPFTDDLLVSAQINSDADIMLYDIAGNKILHQTFSGSINIDTKHLARGIYLYEVKNNNEIVEKGKVVKQ